MRAREPPQARKAGVLNTGNPVRVRRIAHYRQHFDEGGGLDRRIAAELGQFDTDPQLDIVER